MLEIHVSAAISIRDGFTGKPLSDAELLCELDGHAFMPIRKQDGMFVFPDLTDGRHSLKFSRRGFNDEFLELTAARDKTEIFSLTMKPSAHYRFGSEACFLTLSGLEPGAPFWMAAVTGPEIKLSPNAGERGDEAVRLFLKSGASLPAPSSLLVSDGEKTEICTVLDQIDGQWRLAGPLSHSHKRGVRLIPAQSYRADEKGSFRAVFPKAAAVELLGPKGLEKFEVNKGENQWQTRS